ncbi:4-hydroxy-3-methylbut-2-en-1-yl diphosphate synthase (flavodoxin) [Desulfosarcina ovata subsp. sediminis]|uniref:4-hydroxy-3-methylbut-2-en-1-yl diphosphate synthase (flavodoxin) n=2 Tax=Desulfosarcina ovata TaxID=83564 RepID=A0A5K7ZW55_9BACT|nr:4-hydroxy-3-methylbut-2-en-1-yl diphosphate synthase (flavodoxin) [Desulfosarcina ovata subsp. sediminis]
MDNHAFMAPPGQPRMPGGIQRRKTRRIMVGGVAVGDGAPISVQSMTNTKTDDVAATVAQIGQLSRAGCEIVRVAVPDQAAADAIARIKQAIDIPLIADIHFDYRLAIASARAGADGLRFNPGNIGSATNVRALVDCAKDCGIPIRVGVNAGSLEKDILEKYDGATARGMVESAMRHVDLLQDLDFHNIKISIKASDVPRTIAAYRLLSRQTDLPLHVGVTEAGSLYSGIVKSALGIGSLLAEGIGDTLRVSLTRDPVEEVRVGYEILRALDIRHRGPEIISCPTCGRCEIPLFDIVERVEKALLTCTTPVKLAIMGCVVNGPGEAREADIGVAGGRGVGILFKKGQVIKKFPEDQLVDVVLEAVGQFERQLASEPGEPADNRSTR